MDVASIAKTEFPLKNHWTCEFKYPAYTEAAKVEWAWARPDAGSRAQRFARTKQGPGCDTQEWGARRTRTTGDAKQSAYLAVRNDDPEKPISRMDNAMSRPHL